MSPSLPGLGLHVKGRVRVRVRVRVGFSSVEYKAVVKTMVETHAWKYYDNVCSVLHTICNVNVSKYSRN